jgi:LysR family transcriptional regulator, low CO2-responsive transcriptional regulator
MKHITLRQIKIFESVARNLSVSRAAEDLHLTQPAVSMQIKQIEELAGVPLFEHKGKRIILTEGGKLVLRHCLTILADVNAAEQSLADLMSGGIQRLRVGMVTSGSRLFPHLINSFIKTRSGVELDMQVSSRSKLVEMLRNEQVDLAIMVHTPDIPHAVTQPFAEHEFVLVASAAHPLVRARALPLARIAAETVFVREPGTDSRIAADQAFLGQSAAPRMMSLGYSEAIKQSVIAGLGLGLLSLSEAEPDIRAGRLALLDVQGFPLRRHWQAVHRSDRPLPPVARDFLQFLLTEASARLPALAEA